MVINSDYTSSFRNEKSQDLRQIIDKSNKKMHYETNEIVTFIEGNGLNVIWIGQSQGKIYPLFYNGEFHYLETADLSVKKIAIWYEKNVDKLALLEHKPNKTLKLVEDYEDEEVRLASSLEFTKMGISVQDNLQVIKDFELGEYPHNLLLNDESKFLMNSVATNNILSYEWLATVNEKSTLKTSFTKSIWVPIESGDIALNYLYSNIADSLANNNFTTYTEINLNAPLSSDLIIISAHGNKEINTFPAFYAEGHNELLSYTNLRTIIGQGKILIFFVCHSGSIKPDFFSNKMLTIIKDYLKSSYEVVIAPFWALNVGIPKIWLPIFLQSLNGGFEVYKAVHIANMAVKEHYPTPNAYACLHCYGNPFFKVDVGT